MYLIAAVHAVPVLFIAFLTRSKVATTLTGIVMIAVGAGTGSPLYTGVDLFAVAAATWFSWQTMLPRSSSAGTSENKVAKALFGFSKDIASTFIAIIALIAALGAFIIGYNRYIGDCADAKLVQLNMTYEQCYATYIRKR